MPEAIASVILDGAIQKSLNYSVPAHLFDELKPGSRVLVPLKSGLSKGTVLEIKPPMHFPGLLPIAKNLSDETLPQDLFQLCQFISEYYATPLRKVLKLALPSAVRKKGKEKTQFFVKPLLSTKKLAFLCEEMRTTSKAKSSILEIMLKHPQGLLLTQLLEKAQTSKSPIDTLVKQNILAYTMMAIDRSLLEDEDFFPTKSKLLNPSQQTALSSLKLDGFQVMLLHGVTGSGKTEVYLQATQKMLSLGKGVILLVPEIALTSQTIERLRSRFPERMVVLHHRLSDGQRFDAWHAARRGDIRIVIGARSALFSPVQNLGLIIIDEEHDMSYKESDGMPAYHARDVAIMRAKFLNAAVILGSATPSLETYTNALQGKYLLCKLESRVGGALLPRVKIQDMGREKERGIFSEILLEGIKNRMQNGEQTLLFLNRRGYHTSLCCTSCQKIVTCPHCELSLTFHLKQNALSCHICGYVISPPPRICVHCKNGEMLKFRGIGTEQIEQRLHAIFPQLRTLRIDADTTRHKGSHDLLLRQFRSGKADVLIGTQMIAKGLHFPSVTLVGVLQADSALSIPDFRSSETVFQLITQVSGRSGRSTLPGEVIIQTFMPDHPIIEFASKENYLSFYQREMEVRKIFQFPPFKRLIKFTFSGIDLQKTQRAAEQYWMLLQSKIPSTAAQFPLLPAGYPKIKDKFRFQFLIKCLKIKEISKILTDNPFFHKDIYLLIDIDPLRTFH